MAYVVGFTVPNNKPDTKSVFGYIRYHYSKMSVGIIEHDFEEGSLTLLPTNVKRQCAAGVRATKLALA